MTSDNNLCKTMDVTKMWLQEKQWPVKVRHGILQEEETFTATEKKQIKVYINHTSRSKLIL